MASFRLGQSAASIFSLLFRLFPASQRETDFVTMTVTFSVFLTLMDRFLGYPTRAILYLKKYFPGKFFFSSRTNC